MQRQKLARTHDKQNKQTNKVIHSRYSLDLTKASRLKIHTTSPASLSFRHSIQAIVALIVGQQGSSYHEAEADRYAQCQTRGTSHVKTNLDMSVWKKVGRKF